MTRTVNYNPLVVSVTRSELAAYKRRSTAEYELWRQGGSASAYTHRAWAIAIGIAFLVAASYATIAVIQQLGGQERRPNIVIGIVAVLIAVGFGAHRLAHLFQLSTPDWNTWARLDRFARANGLTFSPVENFPGFPGAVFESGHYGRALNVVHSAAERTHRFGGHEYSSVDRVLSIGNYEYTITTEHDTENYDWGFMALKLERRLRHMVLDAKANNSFGRSNLPRVYDKRQSLSLEGDFDRYFSLYCPKKYERDALYLFTPDLMVLLIDKAAPFDVEIVDNWMFVYSARPLNFTDPAVYQRFLHIADTVGKKTFSQSKRYSDERSLGFSENLVDVAGQRLSSRRKESLRQVLTVSSNYALRVFAGVLLFVFFAFLQLIAGR